MKIRTEVLSTHRLKGKPAGQMVHTGVLTGEIAGVSVEYISIKGPSKMHEPAQSGFYDLLLSLGGAGTIQTTGRSVNIGSSHIARIPYNEQYTIGTEKDQEFHFLRIRKLLDDKDIHHITCHPANHETLYIKALNECPEYSEDIKSDQTVNRMILPEGMVPRFCMGSVETQGPDEVAAHEHPMLDQLFYGLPGCNCTCYADHEETNLSENMMLHIPLGSTHAVSVSEGEKLAYIWFDFFLTLEGEKYMNEQHQMDEE
ncbi:MAG: hypothetical protein ABFS38_21950 [Bacteroidota bacterium]